MLSELVLHAPVYVLGNGPDLGGGLSLADEEELRRPVIKLTQIKAHNVFTFDVLNAIQDHVQPLFHVRAQGLTCSRCRCIQTDALGTVR